MLGRATRLCVDLYGPGEDKQRFQIFDAVDLYAALEDVSDMKPVVTKPNITIEHLIDELVHATDDDFLSHVKDQLLTKLRRKKISDDQIERVETATGMDRRALVDHNKNTDPKTLADWFRRNEDAMMTVSASNSNKRPSSTATH